MKNLVDDGNTITMTAAADATSGDLVVAGMLAGVAQSDVTTGGTLVLALGGKYELAKTSAQAWTVGQAIYAVPATGLCTTATTSGNVLVGVAAAVAANPSATGIVLLNRSAPGAAV